MFDLSGRIHQLGNKLLIERMAGFVGDNPADDGATGQTQIADQIDHLMPHTLVGITIGIFDRAVGTDDQNVFGAQMRSDTHRLHLPRLGFQHKCAGTRKVLSKCCLVQFAGIDLSSDAGVLGIIHIIR